jgi:ubiquinone/menaquinone biosynthesis C-methylase UbiE
VSDAARSFDGVASGYDDWYLGSKGRQVFEAERRAIDAMLPSVGVGLEIGAGTGVFAESLTDAGRSVICLDLSRGMLVHAKRRNLPSILASASALPLRGGVFAFAYLVTVIEFLSEPVDVFREAGGVLREGAPLVTLFINPNSPWGELYTRMREDGDPVFSYAKFYRLDQVEKMLLEAGIEPEQAIGALSFGPLEAEAGDELALPTSGVGVILVKGMRKGLGGSLATTY